MLKDANFEPPTALRHLASITDFDLFVSTIFDPLRETAIDLERFGGASSTEVTGYTPNRVNDLPAERDHLTRPGSRPTRPSGTNDHPMEVENGRLDGLSAMSPTEPGELLLHRGHCLCA